MTGISQPIIPPRQMALGALCAMVTVCIWSGWNVVSRLGATESLDANSITFLRFATAGFLSIPIVWRYRAALLATKWWLLLVMIIGAGAPYVWVASLGFVHAPASHGVLIPCAMTLWVALLSLIALKEPIRPLRQWGYGVLTFTIIARMWSHSGGDIAMLHADGYFIAASMLWALYTVCNKVAALPPIAVVAVVALGSMFGFSLPYAATHMEVLVQLPLSASLTQIVYQGVVVSFLALLAYNQAIAYIGPTRASAFTALIPLVTTIIAMPLLQEYPSQHDLLFVLCLTVGVGFATGAVRYLPFFRRKRKAV